MPASTIIVYRSDGSPVKGAKVVLGLSGGMSKPGFTDRDGRVTIDHASTGTAKVFVRGKNCGSFRAPGRTVVTYK